MGANEIGGGEMKIERFFSGDFVLESERLLFRVIVKEDAADFYAYAKDPEVSRYLLWSPHPSLRYTERCIENTASLYREGLFFDFALIDKESGRMIGTAGMTRIDVENRVGEVGYVLSREFWHRGLATEALAVILSFAFHELSLHRVEARFLEGNTASLRVMEKNGMTFEGYWRDALLVKGAYRTVGVCAMLEEEYKERFGAIRTPIRSATERDYPKHKRKGFFSLFV